MQDALAMDSDIHEALIYWAEQLAPRHPVFMLHGYDGDRLVIKHESVPDQDIKINSKVMGAVDRNAKVKVLSRDEVKALSDWAALFGHDRSKGAPVLGPYLTGRGTWIKMKTFKLITLDSAAKKSGAGDKTDVRIIAAALKAPGGLEKLREIVAADMFNGNSDRFYPFGGGCKWEDHRLSSLINVGNIFVAVDPGQNSGVIGLDSIDPNSPYTDLSQILATAEGNEAGDASEKGWPGRLLANNALTRARRLKFAQDIADDLNVVLGPRNRRTFLGSTRRLPDNAAARINAGMETGAQKIRLRLKAYWEKHKGGTPTGLTQRLAILGDP